MKNYKYIYAIVVLSLLFSACDPIEEEFDLGDTLSEEAVLEGISIANEKPGNNKIILKNNLDGIAGIWDFGTGTSSSVETEVVVPPGTYDVKFTALCRGGIVEVMKTVEVTTVEYELDIEWTYLCGAPEDGGKTWVWATGNPIMGNNGTSALFGNGSEFMQGPEWWKGDAAELGEEGVFDEMKFTYTNVSLIDKSNETAIENTTSGKFVLDNATKKIDDSNAIEGYLELPFYPMGMKLDEPAKFSNPYKFEIIKLNENEMTLRQRGGSGGEGWGIIYLLKRKGYEY